MFSGRKYTCSRQVQVLALFSIAIIFFPRMEGAGGVISIFRWDVFTARFRVNLLRRRMYGTPGVGPVV